MSGQANLIALSKESPSEDEWFAQIRNYSWVLVSQAYVNVARSSYGTNIEKKVRVCIFLSRAAQ